MIGGAVAIGGWTAASFAAAAMLVIWRVLARRMEAVARACHELRGPLTAARLGLQLGVGTGELSPARLRAIDLELGRACLALDDLACVRDRGHRALRLDEIDVPELLRDSVEAWQAAAAAATVQLVAQWSGVGARMVGDRFRLAQATGNLIANAIEHGGGRVEVRGRADGDAVRIEVTDRGPGLPAPILALTRRAHGGRGSRGRGLAIAAAIAASHGGRLAVAPSECGAKLVLEFPTVLRRAPVPAGLADNRSSGLDLARATASRSDVSAAPHVRAGSGSSLAICELVCREMRSVCGRRGL